MIPASPNFILPFFSRAIPKRLTFGLCSYVLRLYNAHALYYIPGSPQMIHCSWLDLKQTINNDNNNNNNNNLKPKNNETLRDL